MRPLAYVSDGYPTLSQTFTLREVRALHADGVPVQVFSMHRPGPRDPALDPAVDPPVTYLPSPFSAEVAGAMAAQVARRPLEVARLAALALLPHTDPFVAGFQLRAPVHLAWACWLAPRLPPRAHVHAQFVGAASNVAWMAARLARASFSFMAHAEWGLPLVRRKLEDAAFALAISDFEKARLLARAPGVSPSRVIVSRLGVDLERWAPVPYAPAEGPLRVVAVGMLGPKKGHDVLVRAAAIARDAGVRLRVDIVGEGPERPRLQGLLRELRLDGVVALRGALPHDEVWRLVREADAGALACRVTQDGDFDGIPVALMEAMASGKPVVTCAVSAVPELVEDGVSGLVVPGDRPDLLAQAIRRLAEEPALRVRLAAAARAKVEAEYDAAKARARMARLFRERLGEEGA